MKNINFCILMSIFGLFSCENDVTIHVGDTKNIVGNGELIEHRLDVEKFSKVSVTGQAKLDVVYGDTFMVKVRAQQNIYEMLDLKVINGNFTIGVKENKSISTNKGIYIDIVTPSAIEDVIITGAGTVSFSKGKQQKLNISIAGTATINAFNLEAENVKVTIAGSAQCEVLATKKLDVSISGTGTVKYKGRPSISQSIAGLGSVVSEN
ncbi:MAG TPA: DUF2807 domain-containing protein [Bacteroidales bacterium]|nr:DUF2807 domain-containing protein [Bacteroidales bacterium]